MVTSHQLFNTIIHSSPLIHATTNDYLRMQKVVLCSETMLAGRRHAELFLRQHRCA